MIHLTEAIVGINKRPQRIGNDKLFSELNPGDTVYWYLGGIDANGEFTLDSIKDYNDSSIGNGKHKMKTGAGKGYSYAPYEYKLTFGEEYIAYVPGNGTYMEISDTNDNPIMMVTTSKKEYEKFKKIYKIR